MSICSSAKTLNKICSPFLYIVVGLLFTAYLLLLLLLAFVMFLVLQCNIIVICHKKNIFVSTELRLIQYCSLCFLFFCIMSHKKKEKPFPDLLEIIRVNAGNLIHNIFVTKQGIFWNYLLLLSIQWRSTIEKFQRKLSSSFRSHTNTHTHTR